MGSELGVVYGVWRSVHKCGASPATLCGGLPLTRVEFELLTLTFSAAYADLSSQGRDWPLVCNLTIGMFTQTVRGGLRVRICIARTGWSLAS
jgi:hypothetical protein